METGLSDRRSFFSGLKKELQVLNGLFKGKRVLLYVLSALIVIGILIGSLTPYLFGTLIDSIIASDIPRLKSSMVVFLAINILTFIVELIESVIGNSISIGLACEIKENLLNKILCLKAKEQDKYPSGEWINRLEGDADSIVGFYLDMLGSILMIGINIVISMFFLITISPALTAVAIILLPLGYIINLLFRTRIRDVKKKLKEAEDDNFTLINSIFNSLKNIKVWQLESFFINKYKYINKRRMRTQKDNVNLSQGIVFLQKVNNQIFEMTILIVSAMLIFSGKMSIGNMVSFNSYLEKLFSAISKMLGLNLDKQSVRISMERMNEIDSKEKESTQKSNKKIQINCLEFADVSFGYGTGQVLKRINFSITKPGIYSFVGRNGTGKTTILKLISKLYKVDEGVVTVNRDDVDSIPTYILRNSITYMMKEPLIVSGSLLENLTIGVERNVLESEIADLCKKIQLTSLMARIGGLSGPVTADCLSSGEKQKIGIIRTLLRKSSVILLDESTSDMDGNAENMVASLLEEIAANTIIINICHRKKLVEVSNTIFVLDNKNGIAEMGTYEEFKGKGEVYNELF